MIRHDYASILVVDDNPDNLNVLSDLLDQRGFEILFALDGHTALERAELTRPDLILLDVMMPGIDGFETCRQLKSGASTCDIPVIFMTALDDTVDKVKGFEVGAVDYVTKPIEPEEVFVRITTHLTLQRLQQEMQTKNAELSASLERERELNKLKSRFISMASHELRTPMTTLYLSIDLLHRYHSRMSVEKQGKEFETMKRMVDRMTALLDDVLTVSKGEAGKFDFKPETVELMTICRQLVQEFSGMSEETHTLRFSTTHDEIQATVDPKLLRHILSNLLSNAIKYSPAGGTVSFDVVNTAEEIRFHVEDEGIGIAQSDQVHLFDAFHRGKNVGNIKGTGLGLSIVKQFVELHGGTINVESEAGKGTAFTIVFPV